MYLVAFRDSSIISSLFWCQFAHLAMSRASVVKALKAKPKPMASRHDSPDIRCQLCDLGHPTGVMSCNDIRWQVCDLASGPRPLQQCMVCRRFVCVWDSWLVRQRRRVQMVNYTGWVLGDLCSFKACKDCFDDMAEIAAPPSELRGLDSPLRPPQVYLFPRDAIRRD